MRFRRWPRVSAYEDTPRKRAALARSQRDERVRLPLLRDVIAAQQPRVDEEMVRRAARWEDVQQNDRNRRAADWRRARQRLAARNAEDRRFLAALWRDCPYPADPAYLLDLLHAVETGRIDPHRPPWRFPEAVTPRITADPTAFDQAFRKVGHRKVGGGPKTNAADEFTFIGNFGSGPILLISRVRLLEPNESFYTSSNHRLRDSHVGRAGHWVEIQVRGSCSDAELALIERLAQSVDSRLVVVRRAGHANLREGR